MRSVQRAKSKRDVLTVLASAWPAERRADENRLSYGSRLGDDVVYEDRPSGPSFEASNTRRFAFRNAEDRTIDRIPVHVIALQVPRNSLNTLWLQLRDVSIVTKSGPTLRTSFPKPHQ